MPLLVLHAPLDHTVEIENATEIFVAARHPKSAGTRPTTCSPTLRTRSLPGG